MQPRINMNMRLVEVTNNSTTINEHVTTIVRHVFDGYPTNLTTPAVQYLLSTIPSLQYTGIMYRFISVPRVKMVSVDNIDKVIELRPQTVASFSASADAVVETTKRLARLRGTSGFVLSQTTSGLNVNATLSHFPDIVYDNIDTELYDINDHMHEEEILAFPVNPTPVGIVTDSKIQWL